ncbi:MAG: hypothetical protein WEF86_16220 [Gemmatimonadota bacterium]
MIAPARTHPLTRPLAIAVLVIHVLLTGAFSILHASEQWHEDVAIADGGAPADSGPHDRLCCPFCQMSGALPAPVAARDAVIGALPTDVVPPVGTPAARTTSILVSASPRAPPVAG